MQERKTEPTGLIRLAATFGFGRLSLMPVLAAFQQRYPQVAVQLQLTEQLPDLSRDGFDGAIWLWSGRGVQASQWVSRPVAPNQRVLVASPSYLKQHGEPQSLDIAPHLAGRQLVRILPAWSMPDADIHWLAPYRAEVPRRIRLLIDLLRAEFETEPWKSTLPAAWPPAPPG